MATITAAAGGGDWTTGGTWVGGVAPTAADDAVLDATSGNVTIDSGAVCRSLDCNGYTGTLTNSSFFNSLTIGDGTAGAGNIAMRLSSGMTMAFGSGGGVRFASSSATQQTVICAGKSVGPCTFGYGDTAGNYILSDAFACGALVLTCGTFSGNGQNVTCSTLTSNVGANTRNITLGSGTWTITSLGAVVAFSATNLTFSATGSTILISDTGGSVKQFTGGGLTFNVVRIAAGGTGRVQFSDGNTFVKLERSGTGTKNIRFTAGTTTTLTGGEDAFFSGSSGNVWTIDSTSAGSAATISKASGDLVCDYLSLKDSAATGGATFYAGANSTNVSGNSGWAFSGVGPAITDCDPATGTTHGGTAVTLTGSGFTGATGATFDGDAATGFSVDSDTEITCTTPANPAGAVDVVVQHGDGDATLTDGFTYVTPAPTLSSIDPTSGTVAGGTEVTLTGVDLTDTSGVTFGGDAATSVTVVNDTTVTCVTPAHAAGAVDVVLTTPGGSDTLVGGFTFADVTAPTAASWATNTDGDEITATLSEADCTPASGTGGFTLGGTSATVASWAISGTTLTLTLSGTVYQGQTVTISYNDATASEAIADAADNLLADISGVSVTNNSTVEAPASGGGSTPTSRITLGIGI